MYQVLGDYTQIENLEHGGSFCAFPAARKRLYKLERRAEGSCGKISGPSTGEFGLTSSEKLHPSSFVAS